MFQKSLCLWAYSNSKVFDHWSPYLKKLSKILLKVTPRSYVIEKHAYLQKKSFWLPIMKFCRPDVDILDKLSLRCRSDSKLGSNRVVFLKFYSTYQNAMREPNVPVVRRDLTLLAIRHHCFVVVVSWQRVQCCSVVVSWRRSLCCLHVHVHTSVFVGRDLNVVAVHVFEGVHS